MSNGGTCDVVESVAQAPEAALKTTTYQSFAYDGAQGTIQQEWNAVVIDWVVDVTRPVVVERVQIQPTTEYLSPESEESLRRGFEDVKAGRVSTLDIDMLAPVDDEP